VFFFKVYVGSLCSAERRILSSEPLSLCMLQPRVSILCSAHTLSSVFVSLLYILCSAHRRILSGSAVSVTSNVTETLFRDIPCHGCTQTLFCIRLSSVYTLGYSLLSIHFWSLRSVRVYFFFEHIFFVEWIFFFQRV